jgi:hypothetical protein
MQGHAALTPGLTRYAASGALQYKDGVTGQPGTQRIPVTPTVTEASPAGQAQMGLSRRQDAPDAIWPNLYWARPQRAYYPGAGMPVSVQSDNLMPVPATDPRGIPSTLYMPARNRRGSNIAQPALITRWADASGR